MADMPIEGDGTPSAPCDEIASRVERVATSSANGWFANARGTQAKRIFLAIFATLFIACTCGPPELIELAAETNVRDQPRDPLIPARDPENGNIVFVGAPGEVLEIVGTRYEKSYAVYRVKNSSGRQGFISSRARLKRIASGR